MRHRKSGMKLGRTSSHRKAMFRNMVTSLFKYERIKTTDTKARELRNWADHLITLAKKGDLHARRQALAIVREKAVVRKLFEQAADRFGGRNGGYTRIVKIGRRPGDAAPVSLIELVAPEEKKKKPKKKKKALPVKEASPKTKAKDKDTKAVEEKAEESIEAQTEKEVEETADAGVDVVPEETEAVTEETENPATGSVSEESDQEDLENNEK